MAKEFAVWLKSARNKAGFTQTELFGLSGISQGTISRLERGGGVPLLPTIERLAAALGKESSEGLAAAMQQLGGDDFIIIRRELAGPELAGQIRVTLRSKLLQPGVRSLLRAILDQIEGRER